MFGTDCKTGLPLDGVEHLKQSITDILSTRIGTRVMRRDYGSNLPNLIDRPTIPDEIRVDLYAETSDALKRWEPRFALEDVQFTVIEPGVISMTLTGIYLEDGRSLQLSEIIVR